MRWRSELLLALAVAACSSDARQVVDLRQRRLDDITFAATHNSYNYAPAFAFPNVRQSVPEQLRSGIRGLELDLHYLGGKIMVHHNVAGVLGAQPAADVLRDILGFLKDNPTEMVFLKFESHVAANDLAKLLTDVGATEALYVHPSGAPPPRYGDLQGRLILTSGAPPGLGSGLSECQTRGGRRDPADLWPPKAKRTGDYLTLVAVVVSDLFQAGSPADAAVVNEYDYLLRLADRAWKLNGTRVTRIVVDFPDIGDVYGVVDTLNTWHSLRGEVTRDGAVLDSVKWRCEYGATGDVIETSTRGRFCFPLRPGETVTIMPRLDGHRFEPPARTVTGATGNITQAFRAVAD